MAMAVNSDDSFSNNPPIYIMHITDRFRIWSLVDFSYITVNFNQSGSQNYIYQHAIHQHDIVLCMCGLHIIFINESEACC